MSTKDWISLGTGVGGTVLNTIGQNQARNDAREQYQQSMAMNEEQFNKQFGQNQAALGLQATQMDPFAQQRARQQQAILGSLMSGFKPASYNREAGKFEGGFMGITPDVLAGAQSFFGPSAMAAQESAFNNTARAASPTYQGANPEGAGYSEEARKQFTGASAGMNAPGASGSTPAAQARQTYNLTLPQLGSNKAGNIGGMIGGAAGSFLPGVGNMIGSLIGGGAGKLIGGMTYTKGEKTNDLRDAFKGQFGDTQGTKMAEAIGGYGGDAEVMGAYDLFNRAKSPEELQRAMQILIAELGTQRG
jgi:hypothetical protein